MAYQGTGDLAAMAEDIALSIANGQWEQAIRWLHSLNSLQTVYVMRILTNEYLYRDNADRLAQMVESRMNDNETGEGWIAQNQE